MIVGIGVDIVETSRITEALEKYGERFQRRIFTETEIAYCTARPARMIEHFAARFAAKEAFSKALGTGMAAGVAFRDIGVVNRPGGKPELVLTGQAALRAAGMRSYVTLSHQRTTAVAVVVLESDGQDEGAAAPPQA